MAPLRECRFTHREPVSVDQVAAGQIGGLTRFPSLCLSTDGGVGESTRSSTLSFARNGLPIPSLNRSQQIFARLFGVETTTEAKREAQLIHDGALRLK